MKRKLFYLFERLQIKRSERIAITTLLCLILVLMGFYSFPEILFSNEKFDYSYSDSLFAVKSALLKQERDEILLRYQPIQNEEEIDEKRFSSLLTSARQDTVPPDSASQGTNNESVTLININTATAEKLQELPGIGPAYASRIVEWREEHGQFVSKDQLIEIKGIGEKRLAAIKPLIQL